MSNNINHNADYSVKTSFGHCSLGFKKPSGMINPLAALGSKLIKTPLGNPLNKRWNALVNDFIAEKNIDGLELMKRTMDQEPKVAKFFLKASIEAIEEIAA
jgi:hypothetical protein